MSEPVDIRRILRSWPYEAEDDARIVNGDEGRQILQVRLPMGLEQYELDGRPDGARPHGKESVLDYHSERLAQARADGAESDFGLDAEECGELFSEGTLYYFRYVRLFQLRDWPRTIRDTARNLRVFDLVRRYARRPEDQVFLEKWRPYIVRVNATAGAMMALDQNAFDQAARVAGEALQTIEALPDLEDETFAFERERSLKALRELINQIQRNRPLSELERLQRQLHRAIERQEFERAARLRDRIRALKGQQVC